LEEIVKTGDPDELLRQIERLIEKVINKKVEAIGIGVPIVVDVEQERLKFCPTGVPFLSTIVQVCFSIVNTVFQERSFFRLSTKMNREIYIQMERMFGMDSIAIRKFGLRLN